MNETDFSTQEVIESTDVSAVKADIASDIELAQISGLDAFNAEEKAEWLESVDICETLEIALSLYSHLADFIRDGMTVVSEIQGNLKSSALSDLKKQDLLEQAQILTFAGKQDIVREIELAVCQAEELLDRTLKIIGDEALSVAERQAVIEYLNTHGASEEATRMANRVVRVARERLQSRQAVWRVESSLREGKVAEARNKLVASFGVIPTGEYIHLEQNITSQEIKIEQLYLKVA